MKVKPIINEDFNEPDCVELGNAEHGYQMLTGYITENNIMIYTNSIPNYCPVTGQKLNLEG